MNCEGRDRFPPAIAFCEFDTPAVFELHKEKNKHTINGNDLNDIV